MQIMLTLTAGRRFYYYPFGYNIPPLSLFRGGIYTGILSANGAESHNYAVRVEKTEIE